jgi:hypothetical protein
MRTRQSPDRPPCKSSTRRSTITKKRLLCGLRHFSPRGSKYKVFSQRDVHRILGPRCKDRIRLDSSLIKSMRASISPSVYPKQSRSKLPTDLERLLVCEKTLVQMARFSLIERVRLINTLHPDTSMTVYKLTKLYKKHEIRYKLVKHKRCWRRDDDTKGREKDELMLDHLRDRVSSLIKADQEIVWVDEVMFTQNTYKS